MLGLTKDERKKLDGLLVEYGLSLTRQDDEKAKQKAMEEIANVSLKIEPAHFKSLAKAIWKDARAQVQKGIETQLDLFLLYDQEGVAQPETARGNPAQPETARGNPSRPRGRKDLAVKNSVVATYDPPGALQ